jgi:hypothetical protein
MSFPLYRSSRGEELKESGGFALYLDTQTISISRRAKRRLPTRQRLPETEPIVRLAGHLLVEGQM